MDTAEVIHSGQSQVVRLPEGFRFEGTKVLIKKVGDAVVLLPYRNDWQVLFDSLEMFSADYMEENSDSAGRAVPEMEH
ncbi:MAG TPA: type II toxin-antitoxin system VapB family antitoxin [Anaerolineae bacterium]|nr:type II toxin-antitoxin system VapB family antitoxin [Anaerolineae bacterium]